MLKQISKFAPMSVDLAKAIESDQAVINEDGTYDYIDGNDNEDVIDATVETPNVDENGVVKEEPKAEQVEPNTAPADKPEKDDLADELNN